MAYTLNLAEDGRYLSACDSAIWCPNGHPVADSLPTGETEAEKDPNNWRYVNSEWIYDPKPVEPAPEPAPSLESRVATVESDVAALTTAIEKGLAL